VKALGLSLTSGDGRKTHPGSQAGCSTRSNPLVSLHRKTVGGVPTPALSLASLGRRFVRVVEAPTLNSEEERPSHRMTLCRDARTGHPVGCGWRPCHQAPGVGGIDASRSLRISSGSARLQLLYGTSTSTIAGKWRVRRHRRGVQPMPSVPRRSLRRRLSKARRRSGSHSSQQGRSSRGRSSRRRCDCPPESP
jgi:hypothetical protein